MNPVIMAKIEPKEPRTRHHQLPFYADQLLKKIAIISSKKALGNKAIEK